MTVSERVELAHEPDFTLGRLTVSPSRREVVRDDGQREVIEHRVMQVLIALSKARGAIVTRDELITSCWDGRVVGEDSIHRALSRLRKVASGIGAGSIEIETITKIGYRLTSDPNGAAEGGATAPEAAETRDDRGPARRARRGLLVGAGALGLLAAGASGLLAYRRSREPPPPPEVQALVSQARQLRDQNVREAQQQAIGLMRRVVAIAPDYADGWGMLGCAYAIPSHYRPRAEALDLRARAEAAGRRALELDAGNGYGELALSIALPFIGYWLERDRRLERALADRPDDDEMLTFRAVALIFVGRSREALSYYDRIRQRPLTPAAYSNYIRALWSAGRIEEADRAMDDAASLYPSQETIWITRFHIAMFGERPSDAIALAEHAPGRPSGIDGAGLAAWTAQARALENRDPAQVEAVREVQMERARVSAFGAEYAIRVLSALGRIDDAFAVAEAYYFARGFTVPDQPGPAAEFTPNRRQTRLLFEPVTRPMRADSRFETLVREIGLDRYWRESDTPPDYRRT